MYVLYWTKLWYALILLLSKIWVSMFVLSLWDNCNDQSICCEKLSTDIFFFRISKCAFFIFYTTTQRHLNIFEEKNNIKTLNIPTMSYTKKGVPNFPKYLNEG